MARTVTVTVCWVAILIACVDDSIAARTVTPDDDHLAALDNDYLSNQPTPQQLVEHTLELVPPCDRTFTSSETPRRAAAAAFTAHFRHEPRDVRPLIMRC
jgi:hypothetical protein